MKKTVLSLLLLTLLGAAALLYSQLSTKAYEPFMARTLPKDPAPREEEERDPDAVRLVEAGFPEYYAEKLARLGRVHPDWTFLPLNVTALSGGKYTWDYVVYQETDAQARRSLVTSGDSYIPERDFLDMNQYDTGWYKASPYIVEYLIDTRNFLTEDKIFQFMELGWNDSITLDAVKTVLRGTFMEEAPLDGIYSDTTYAEFFYKTGRERGLSPVYLATCCRNEQGVAGTSPLISGTCGDTLWSYYSRHVTGSEGGRLILAPSSGWTESGLKAYNGLYNYFNLGAGGTGTFAVYLGGMSEAKKGTAAKAAEWGSGGAWNTRWKAIYGGASALAAGYLGDYQNTYYLQKFNVDPRSHRNFWGQYMQSVYGGYSRGVSAYQSFRENGLLELPYTFVIPFYEGMPEEECAKPKGGEFAKRALLRGEDVKAYTLLDLKTIPGAKAQRADKISWRVLQFKNNEVFPLGELDLSGYTSMIIEYSVPENFLTYQGNERALFGLISDRDHPLGSKDAPADESALLGSAGLKSGREGGLLARQYATIDLSQLDHRGEVFLSAYLAPGQRVMVHNIALITK